MKNINTPKLTLVGAGPGDPELITLKGIKAIKNADVILYDALVNPELLKYAAEKTPKIYVGKRASNHTYSQDEINKLIVESAFKYGHVVRLKGGDSFVFGRGMEELLYAASFDIEGAVVPGISSSIGVPALQKIPVTHRGLSESFWVITGTTSDGSISKDIYDAAKTNATVVILMGMNKLKEIADIFIAAGKADIPFAIIQNGSLKEERIATGEITEIVAIAESEKLGAPAIIIIGETVSLNHALQLNLTKWKSN